MVLLKSSSLAVCSNSNLPTYVWPFTFITSPVTVKRTSADRLLQRPRPKNRNTRHYATIRDESRHPLNDSSAPNSKWPSCANPTPYQIFDQKVTAPYSKARFYELVKIYHPDRHRQISGGILTEDIRLERYRLVVAANEILSDPVKRRAYDMYGAGWGSIRSMDNAAFRHADHSWRNEPGNPSMNATWEDWERWYSERNGGQKQKQHPLFMSNELFVVVLCSVVVVASMGQARRASNTTMNLVDMRDQRHEAISHEMAKRRMEQGPLSRHERVESFLRQREGWSLPESGSSHGQHQESK